jgi:hypothetical protein
VRPACTVLVPVAIVTGFNESNPDLRHGRICANIVVHQWTARSNPDQPIKLNKESGGSGTRISRKILYSKKLARHKRENEMPTPGQELSSIDFGSMLGGPLCAVITAQAQSAMTTVDFIKSVGFEAAGQDADGNPTPGQPIYVSFRYPKEIAPFQPATPVVISIAVATSTQGSGYASAPAVTIAGGSGTGATAVAVLTGDKVTAVNITNQ